MSWKDAKTAAIEWVKQLNLPTDLTGQTFDLAQLAAKLPHQGAFREMVLRAAARIIRQRGGKLH
jgi:hypothetical protein